MPDQNTNPTPPRVAKFPTTDVTWSDGTTKFNGFALIGFIPPIRSAVTYTENDFDNAMPAEALPNFAIIPIIQGQFNGSCGLFWTTDAAPPGLTYNISYYDTTGRLVSTVSSPFTVTADPISLPSQTLTIPTSGGVAPTPN